MPGSDPAISYDSRGGRGWRVGPRHPPNPPLLSYKLVLSPRLEEAEVGIINFIDAKNQDGSYTYGFEVSLMVIDWSFAYIVSLFLKDSQTETTDVSDLKFSDNY